MTTLTAELRASSIHETKARIQSIDVLRGVIMVIMALDHVRDFFHIHGLDEDATNLTTTTPLLFFTRWITHYCAPNFLFLSGLSAYLSGRSKTKAQLSADLVKRGLFLILIELIVTTFAFTFDPLFHTFILQVIWAIGVSMIILGLLVRAPLTLIFSIGLIIMFGHNLFDYVQLKGQGTTLEIVNFFVQTPPSLVKLDKTHTVFVLYAAVPWLGAMLLGYSAGRLYEMDNLKRKKILLFLGFSAIILFILIRGGNHYGDPRPWMVQKESLFTLLSFLNVNKYPPSLDYFLMTIGPGLIFLALTESANSTFANFLKIYGRVPFFYYVVHFYVIHVLCVIAFFV
ncbi:MAG: DUF1624 domain-containing protein, partial [Chitinophagaceae bacterium]|nr:DUF1624 domain-containing protein [Chitinophagaceae bacterium]